QLSHTPRPPTTYLHSFPTRRSSDLARDDVGGLSDGIMNLFCPEPPHQLAREQRLPGRAPRAVVTGGQLVRIRIGNFAHQRFQIRSEEHTSELQSRGHLVCRLLLEKK